MERCVECLKTVRQNPRALFALKVYSLLSGILLFVAGLLGLIMVFKSPFYIVIGVYAMLFGFTVIGVRTAVRAARHKRARVALPRARGAPRVAISALS